MVVIGRAPANDHEVVVGKTLFDGLSFLGHGLAVGKTNAFIGPGPSRTVDLTVTGVFRTGDELDDSTICGFCALGRHIAGLPAADYSSLSVARPDEVEPVGIRRALADSKPPVQVVRTC